MDSKAGLYWNTSRVVDGTPHQLTFSGPDLGNASNFVFRDYANGTNQVWNDKGHATALSGKYTVGEGFLRTFKFGTRYAHQQSQYNSYSFSGKPLTVDGLPLNAARSNGISADTLGVTQQSPTNFMRGDAGYAGGYVVYSPGALLGNQVAGLFPKAGIPLENAYVENVGARRFIRENTLAGYVMGEFAALDDRITGNVGVRMVRTDSRAVAMNSLVTPGVFTENTTNTSYTNALPSLNLTGFITPDFLARFGYGKGLTRAPLDQLNPTLVVNTVTGTGNAGNPALRPQTANSFDLSLERYFNKTNYVSAAIFDKEIDGFFNGIVECQTVAGVAPYSGSQSNSCGNGQYQITKSVNSEKGNARGVEVAGQYFFDSFAAPLKNFGVSGSTPTSRPPIRSTSARRPLRASSIRSSRSSPRTATASRRCTRTPSCRAAWSTPGVRIRSCSAHRPIQSTRAVSRRLVSWTARSITISMAISRYRSMRPTSSIKRSTASSASLAPMRPASSVSTTPMAAPSAWALRYKYGK
jgi:iron complex outermembrane receptor protein